MSKKYEVTVWTENNQVLKPVIEASCSGEAMRIAKAQYPNAKSVSAAKEVG